MIWALLKKEILQVLRDRNEVTLLLVMPFILISILGFALGAVMNEGEEKNLNVKVAYVDEGDIQSDKVTFEEKIRGTVMKEDAVSTILATIEKVSLQDLLIHEVLKGASIFEIVQEDNAEEALRNSDYAAVLVFPEGYRIQSWGNTFLNEKKVLSPLPLHLNDSRGMEATIVSNVIHSFMEQYQWNAIIGNEFALANITPTYSNTAIDGEKITLKGSKPITSFQYYTVGMSVMFVLYVASFISGYALYEKQQSVFQRIILANVSPMFYIFSKWLTGTILAFFQLCILFGLSYLIYGVHWGNIALFFVVTIAVSVVVGAFGVLTTSINYHFNSERATSLFSNIIVTILAFIGGSFISWKAISETLWKVGAYTPNG